MSKITLQNLHACLFLSDMSNRASKLLSRYLCLNCIRTKKSFRKLRISYATRQREQVSSISAHSSAEPWNGPQPQTLQSSFLAEPSYLNLWDVAHIVVNKFIIPQTQLGRHLWKVFHAPVAVPAIQPRFYKLLHLSLPIRLHVQRWIVAFPMKIVFALSVSARANPSFKFSFAFSTWGTYALWLRHYNNNLIK